MKQHTIVGLLRDGKIVPYVSRFNVPVLLVHEGEHSPEKALKTAHYSLKMKTWMVRAIGWLLIFFAVTSTSSIISATGYFTQAALKIFGFFLNCIYKYYSLRPTIAVDSGSRSSTASQW